MKKMSGLKKTARRWLAWWQPIIVVVVVTCSFRSAVADWNVVPTGSMRPTIIEGDRIFVNKVAYDLKVPFTQWRVLEWAQPLRGDVVVLFSPEDGKRLVKRVVGVPGDVVEMRNNLLIVNGVAARYNPTGAYVSKQMDGSVRLQQAIARETLDGRAHSILLTRNIESKRSFEPVTLPAGQFFVLGDNRDRSGDSRYFGTVARDLFVGRASRVVISLDPDNHSLPRWDRLLGPTLHPQDR